MANIYLIGPMGAGKSTVARTLAAQLGWDWTDTDLEVEAAAGRPIPAIFAAEGEEGFRRREEEALARVAERDGLVVATGGGIVLRPVNRERMRRTGWVVYLTAPPEVLWRRLTLGHGVSDRPLLRGEDGQARLAALVAAREPLYQEVADLVVDTRDRGPAEVAAIIARWLAAEGRRLDEKARGPRHQARGPGDKGKGLGDEGA